MLICYNNTSFKVWSSSLEATFKEVFVTQWMWCTDFTMLDSNVLSNWDLFFAYKNVVSISDCVSCITLKGRWCDIIVLNLHDPTDDKDDDIKDS